MTGGCDNASDVELQFDVLLQGGSVFRGREGDELQIADVGIVDGRIVFVGNGADHKIAAGEIINATGLIVAPGFIDPHTHADEYELVGETTNSNLNYLTQGVTTVFIGNDGGGPVDVAAMTQQLTDNGIGTNVAMYIGHGSLRDLVMDGEDRAPSAAELQTMQSLVETAMQDGALGLSTGLYYAPGSFAEVDEVVALATVAASYGGVYDTHIRDESSYNIGLLGAIKEALDIGKEADIHVHIAHIKALGVDVWGQSAEVIRLIEEAHAAGQAVTADQYPWLASGTSLRNTIVPRRILAGSGDEYLDRLADPEVVAEIRPQMIENLRRRGGPESLLVIESDNADYVGKTLEEIAADLGVHPVDAAVTVMLVGSTRVASFNMNPEDVQRYMQQEWVMTSSDGNDGHPRKYASYPQKWQSFVMDEAVISVEDFLYRSAGLVAATFGLDGRGRIEEGYLADIVVFDPDGFAPTASFSNWNSLSEGVNYLLVNGNLVIKDGDYTGALPGIVIKKQSAN